MNFWKKQVPLLAVSLPIVLADQISKALVVAGLDLYESWPPVPALRSLFVLTHTRNTGAAFSILPGANDLFILVGVAAAVVVVYFYSRLVEEDWPLLLALATVLGGMVGNLYDRIRLGYVVDFLHVRGLPIFNLADIALVGGVAILFLLTWWQERRQPNLETESNR